MAKKNVKELNQELECICRMGKLKDDIFAGIDERNKELAKDIKATLEKKADKENVSLLWKIVISSLVGTSTLVTAVFIFFSNKVEKIYEMVKLLK